MTGQIYVDRKAPLALRAAAQGMITFITYGAGMFLGAWLSGKVVDLYVVSTPTGVAHVWRSIWLLPAFCSAAVLILFALAFGKGENGITAASTGDSSLASPAINN